MFDAVDKFPSGFLDGNTLFLGSYDECERIYSVGTEQVNLPPFRGQYCMVYLSPPDTLIGGQASVSTRLMGLVSASRDTKNVSSIVIESHKLIFSPINVVFRKFAT